MGKSNISQCRHVGVGRRGLDMILWKVFSFAVIFSRIWRNSSCFPWSPLDPLVGTPRRLVWNLVWHWNGKRRLILELRFRWRMRSNLINQTKHRQPYLFRFAWEKKKQTKHSNTTQTNIAVYVCTPALNTFVTLLALSGSSVHASVCPWVPHSARCARLARRSRDDQKTLSIHFPERPFCLNF